MSAAGPDTIGMVPVGFELRAGALERAGALDPEELCDRLLAEVGRANGHDIAGHDIALLAVRPIGGPA